MAHGLGPTRAKVLELLQTSGEMLSVAEVAEEVGLHRNSARFHLEALEELGYVEHTTQSTGSQGRPPLLYSATQDSPTIGALHLLELTEILLRHFVAPAEQAPELARGTGYRWGLDCLQNTAMPEPHAAASSLVEQLRLRGFATTLSEEGIVFTRCPFRGVVSDDLLPLVCSVHAGFLAGYLETAQTSQQVSNLSVGDEVCVAALA